MAISHNFLGYYLSRAKECEKVAAGDVLPETHEIMLYVASRWRALAEEDQAGVLQDQGVTRDPLLQLPSQ